MQINFMGHEVDPNDAPVPWEGKMGPGLICVHPIHPWLDFSLSALGIVSIPPAAFKDFPGRAWGRFGYRVRSTWSRFPNRRGPSRR